MVDFAMDEHPKPKTTIEQLAKLPTVFKKVNQLGVFFTKKGTKKFFLAGIELIRFHKSPFGCTLIKRF